MLRKVLTPSFILQLPLATCTEDDRCAIVLSDGDNRAHGADHLTNALPSPLAPFQPGKQPTHQHRKGNRKSFVMLWITQVRDFMRGKREHLGHVRFNGKSVGKLPIGFDGTQKQIVHVPVKRTTCQFIFNESKSGSKRKGVLLQLREFLGRDRARSGPLFEELEPGAANVLRAKSLGGDLERPAAALYR